MTDYMKRHRHPHQYFPGFVGTVTEVRQYRRSVQIVSNTLRLTRDTVNLNIAKNAVRVTRSLGGVSQRDSFSNRRRRVFPWP